MSKCYFQSDWINNPKYTWLCEVPNDRRAAFCILCNAKFSLSNMGLRAVTSHQNGKKHQLKDKNAAQTESVQHMFSYMKNSNVNISSSTTDINTSNNMQKEKEQQALKSTESIKFMEQKSEGSQSSKGIDKYFLKEDVSSAEIIWCIEAIMTHKSLRSAEKDVNCFSKMFSDSVIAKHMHLGRDKMAYTIVYGIYPFFKDCLIEDLLTCNHLVIGFDESLNKLSQKQQMDLNVRYWCLKSNKVKTRYLTSAFLGRTRASDLLCAFQDAFKPLDLKKLLQISMDGPNVNVKFFRELSNNIKKTPEDPEILNMGSCGLHAVNVAFKVGAASTNWNIMEFLRALYYLFKDSPARRSLYIQYTNSDVFPRKFCCIRWLENLIVAERALDMIPHIKIFIDAVQKDKVAPNSKSFTVVKTAVKDHLLPAKLVFFKLIALEIELFLREYQTDLPLIPFLYDDLTNLTLRLIERFVQKDYIKKNLMEIDFEDSTIFLPYKKVDIGISTLCSLKKVKVSESDIVSFRKDCRNFLLNSAKKLMERSPLIYELTKGVSCLNPKIAVSGNLFLNRLTKLLLILCQKNWITDTIADCAKSQFKAIISQQHIILQLQSYKRSERIDEFWFKILSSQSNSEEAIYVLKVVMILSHGNSNIERGFSINSDCLWENMKEESLVARRTVYDSIIALGGMEYIEVTKKMIHNARNAYSKFKEAKENKSKEEKGKSIAMKKKRESEFQLKELQVKRIKILEEAHIQSEQIQEEIAHLQNKNI